MTCDTMNFINPPPGDVDAHGAMIRALAGLLEALYQAIISDKTARTFGAALWFGARQGFITQLGP